MSWFTSADAAYLKEGLWRISRLSGRHSFLCCTEDSDAAANVLAEHNAELARLEAFIDGCTLEKRKGE